MALVFIILKMELEMKDNIKMVRDMGGEKFFFKTVIVMKDRTKMGREMEWEFTNGLMEIGKKMNLEINKINGKRFFCNADGRAE